MTSKKGTAGRDRTLSLENVIKKPRITEKSVKGMNSGSYCFDVDARANKVQIADAITRIYKVTPRAVRVVNTMAREVMNRKSGKMGMTAATRKAYVYLKKGDTIALM